jgi:hypothetical protein
MRPITAGSFSLGFPSHRQHPGGVEGAGLDGEAELLGRPRRLAFAEYSTPAERTADALALQLLGSPRLIARPRPLPCRGDSGGLNPRERHEREPVSAAGQSAPSTFTAHAFLRKVLKASAPVPRRALTGLSARASTPEI